MNSTLALIFITVSATFHLPPGMLRAISYVESHHNVKAKNLRDAGEASYGLCEVKYTTARSLGFKGTRKQLMDPFVNVYYAGKYLRKQINRYKDVKKGVIAYNIGHYIPGAKSYYKKVMAAYKERR